MTGKLIAAITAAIKSWSLPQQLAAALAVVVIAGGATAGVVAAQNNGPTRSPQAFCKTYADQKQQYLDRYAKGSPQPTNLADAISGITQSLAAMGDWVVIFDHLDKVAPDDIEPDIARVRDSLQHQQDAAATGARDPLTGVASGLVTSLLASSSWQRVDDYVTHNCGDDNATTVATNTSNAMLGHGLVIGNCDPGGTLSLVDPDTGVVKASVVSGSDADSGPVPVSILLCRPKRVSRDLSKFSVAQTFPDGSVHAGYKDASDGTFHDVSASLHPTGFGDKPTRDEALGFADDGSEFFTSDYQPYEASPPNYAPVKVRPADPNVVWSPHHTDAFFVTDRSANFTLRLPDNVRQDNDSEYPNDFATVVVSNPASDGVEGGCAEPQWVSDTQVLCTTPSPIGNDAYLLDLSHKQVGTVQQTPDGAQCDLPPCHLASVWQVTKDAYRSVLPDNSRSNTNFTPSPDGTRMAFLSTQNGIESLYTVGFDAGAQPKPVAINGMRLDMTTTVMWR